MNRRIVSFLVVLTIFFLFASEIEAQSRHRSFTVKEVQGNSRRSSRVSLPTGTQLVVLQKRTSKRDRYGTLARLRLRESSSFPEVDRSGYDTFSDEVISTSRTKERYSLTDAGSNVYFIYALSPSNDLYQSVAWSSTRNQYEPAFERFVGQEIDMKSIASGSRKNAVLDLFFGGALSNAPLLGVQSDQEEEANDETETSEPDPSESDEEASIADGQAIVPIEKPDFSAGSDVKMKVLLSELTGDDQVPLRTLPVSSKVAMFSTAADISEGGYSLVPLPNSDLPFPESTQTKPTFATLSSGGNGPELSRQLPKTDVLNPSAYFFYALTPAGKLYQSVGNTGSHYVPAYETVRTGTFIMTPVLDANRSKQIRKLYWEEAADYSWWKWALPLVLGLFGLFWLLSRQAKKKELAAEKEWEQWVKNDKKRKGSSSRTPKEAPVLDGRFDIFEKADDAYFLNELDPHLTHHSQELRDQVILYRNQVRENIQAIFVEDFETGFKS